MATHPGCPLCPGTWSCLRRMAVIPRCLLARDPGQAVNNQVCAADPAGSRRPAGEVAAVGNRWPAGAAADGRRAGAAGWFLQPPAWLQPEPPTQRPADLDRKQVLTLKLEACGPLS